MPFSMQIDDLQHIITDKSAQLANRRTFHFVVAVFTFLVISSTALLVSVLAMASRPCTTPSATVVPSSDPTSPSSGSSNRVAPHGDGRSSGAMQQCMSPGCLQASSGVLASMDPTADPCQDFHKFACGGWIAKHSIPPDQTYISVFDHLFSESERKLRETLESPVIRRAENSSERKMKEFFSLCVHDYGRMKDGGKALVEEIRSRLGGWYLLDPDTWASHWNFQDTLINAHTDYGVPVLFNYYVSPDPKDRKKNIIGVQLPTGEVGDHDIQSTSGAKRRTLFKKYVRALGTLMLRDSGETMGDEKSKQTMDIFVNDVYNQEMALTQLRNRVSETERWEGHIVSLRELATNFTQVDWVTIFTRIFEDAGVTPDTSIALTSLPYFQGLEELLRTEAPIRDRMMNNYMVWTVVHTLADHLSWEYRQHKFALLEQTTGRREFPSTWHACLSLMKTHMGFALAVELARTHMADTGREEVEKMVNYIKKSAQLAIDNSQWMDAETKVLAKAKVEYMEAEIGFPPILSEQSEVDQLYSQLKVNKSESFFKNLLYASGFKKVLANIEYQTGYKYNLWEYAFFYNPLGVRPLYLWFYNTLIVPPGAFSYPLYTFTAPQAINFGALGSYLAARMVRSVDEVGRLVLNGTFSNWWSTYSLAHYLMETDCYVRYFTGKRTRSYLIDGQPTSVSLHEHEELMVHEQPLKFTQLLAVFSITTGRLVWLNGTFQSWWTPRTLVAYGDIGECFLRSLVNTPLAAATTTINNKTVIIDGHYQVIRVVAETAGLRLAYGAYQSWIEAHHKEPSLPGLNMTSSQLFFLAAAQARCTLRRDQSAYDLAVNGALPVDIMLNTMVTHVEQFAKAFQCPRTSKLVPKERCGVFISGTPED